VKFYLGWYFLSSSELFRAQTKNETATVFVGLYLWFLGESRINIVWDQWTILNHPFVWSQFSSIVLHCMRFDFRVWFINLKHNEDGEKQFLVAMLRMQHFFQNSELLLFHPNACKIDQWENCAQLLTSYFLDNNLSEYSKVFVCFRQTKAGNKWYETPGTYVRVNKHEMFTLGKISSGLKYFLTHPFYQYVSHSYLMIVFQFNP